MSLNIRPVKQRLNRLLQDAEAMKKSQPVKALKNAKFVERLVSNKLTDLSEDLGLYVINEKCKKMIRFLKYGINIPNQIKERRYIPESKEQSVELRVLFGKMQIQKKVDPVHLINFNILLAHFQNF